MIENRTIIQILKRFYNCKR